MMTDTRDLTTLTSADIDTELAANAQRASSAQTYLDNTTKSYKKTRQMRGAAAFKRAWALEEQMKKYQSQLDRLAQEAAELKAERDRRTA